MKTLLLSIAIAFGAAGCLSSSFEPFQSASDDLAQPPSPSGGQDLAMSQSQSPADLGGGGGGLGAFGASCTLSTDCASGLCEQFVQGTVHRCTKSCTVATQTTDCPPPSDGTCNNNGYCKFDQ